MNQDNRVLARTQARDLSEAEIQAVAGGLRTLTVCTLVSSTVRDGDTGEC